MCIRIVDIDLPKPSHLLTDLPVGVKSKTVLNNVLLEGDLRAGKQAHCNGRLFHRRKTARDGVHEFRGYQLVSDLCRSGRKQVQTVVTHGRYSFEQPEWYPSSSTTSNASGDLMIV